jgi:hypothetical protein
MPPEIPQPSDLDEAVLLERAHAKAATARDAGEWFDIYTEIVEMGVKKVMESAGDGHLVLEKLAPRRRDAAVVRRDFIAHGLPLSEAIKCEGPEVTADPNGNMTQYSFPRGMWVRFIWPDRSKLEFRGSKAIVAIAFIQWWVGFHQHYKQLVDPSAPKKKRIIEAHTPEWDAYMRAKALDQSRQLKGPGFMGPGARD